MPIYFPKWNLRCCLISGWLYGIWLNFEQVKLIIITRVAQVIILALKVVKWSHFLIDWVKCLVYANSKLFWKQVGFFFSRTFQFLFSRKCNRASYRLHPVTWSSERCSCPWQGVGTWWFCEVVSNPNHPVLLCKL